MDPATDIGVDAFFADRPVARDLFQALCGVVAGVGPTTLVATKSRVAWALDD